MARNAVVLPAPFGPSRTVIRPLRDREAQVRQRPGVAEAVADARRARPRRAVASTAGGVSWVGGTVGGIPDLSAPAAAVLDPSWRRGRPRVRAGHRYDRTCVRPRSGPRSVTLRLLRRAGRLVAAAERSRSGCSAPIPARPVPDASGRALVRRARPARRVPRGRRRGRTGAVPGQRAHRDERRSGLGCGHGRGRRRGASSVTEYSPNEVKDAVAGFGGADKAQVQQHGPAAAGARRRTRPARRSRCRSGRADPRRPHRRRASRRGRPCPEAPHDRIRPRRAARPHRRASSWSRSTASATACRSPRRPCTRSASSARAVFLHVHHHRREDAETLYGFASIEERRVFETLIGTHGVGPVARAGDPVGALAARPASRPGHRRRRGAVPGAGRRQEDRGPAAGRAEEPPRGARHRRCPRA